MKKYIVTVDNKKYEVVVEEAAAGATFTAAPKAAAPAAAPVAAPAAAPAPAPVAAGNGQKVTSPMPGTILKVVAQQGAAVKKGEILCVLEAMKMENEIFAPCDGTITSVGCREGASVNTGDLLYTIA